MLGTSLGYVIVANLNLCGGFWSDVGCSGRSPYDIGTRGRARNKGIGTVMTGTAFVQS